MLMPELKHTIPLLAAFCIGFSYDATAANSIRLSVDKVEIDEGGFTTFGVYLNQAPPEPVTVTVSEVAGGDPSNYASTVCRFWFYLGGTQYRTVDVALYDGQTPANVANFLDYVKGDHYNGTFIHRSDEGFVIQGGGYVSTADGFEHIPTFDPVVNEPSRSNVRGTIAFAKKGGQPDSATAEWFFSVGDNSANLDFQNGGFSAFGEVLGDGMEVIDEINGLPVFSTQGLTSVPYHDYDPQAQTYSLVQLPVVEVVTTREIIFDHSNWYLRQDVRLHSAPDEDNQDGQTVIRVSGDGFVDRFLTVTEKDNAVGIELEEDDMPVIPEGGEASFRFRLSARPHGDVEVNVSISGPDDDIQVIGPDTLSFTTENWDTYQAVTFSADADPDAADGEAVVSIAGSGVHTDQFFVREDDDDLLSVEIEGAGPHVVPEGGTASIRVRLTAQPVQEVTIHTEAVVRESDIRPVPVVRYNTPLGDFDVELFDREMPETTANFIQYVSSGRYRGMFFHSVAGELGIVESGLYRVVSGGYYAGVSTLPPIEAEPGFVNERGMLAMVPYVAEDQTVIDTRWFINLDDNSEGLTAYPAFGRVMDDGMTILDQLRDLPTFDLETHLDVNVGGALSAVPMYDWVPEDGPPSSSQVVGTGVYMHSPPSFNPLDWEEWKEVVLRCDHDADFEDGEVVFRLTPSGGVARLVTVREDDDDLGVLVDRSDLSVPEGGTEQVGVRLSRPPLSEISLTADIEPGGDPDLAVVDGQTLIFSPGQRSEWQYVTVGTAEDQDTANGLAWLVISQASGTDPVSNLPQIALSEADDDFILEVSSEAGGDVDPAGQFSVDSDDLPVLLTATPDPGMAVAEWVSDVPGLLDSFRHAQVRVVIAESATVKARFDTDEDGDAIPDGWERDRIAPHEDIFALLPGSDPDRDGRTTREEFLNNGEPLLYEMPVSPGWNCLGMGAGAREASRALRDRDFWRWCGKVYRMGTAFDPFQGCWVYADSPETVSIPVRAVDPPAEVDIEVGWNLVMIDRPELVGAIADVFGPTVGPVGWAWQNHTLQRTESIQLRVPVWIRARVSGRLTLGAK